MGRLRFEGKGFQGSQNPGWLSYGSGKGGGGGESRNHPAFFLIQRLTLTNIPKVRDPLSSTFSDLHAGRTACKTKRGDQEMKQGHWEGHREESSAIPFLDRRFVATPTRANSFPCSGGSGLVPYKRVPCDRPSLIAQALFVAQLFLLAPLSSSYSVANSMTLSLPSQ